MTTMTRIPTIKTMGRGRGRTILREGMHRGLRKGMAQVSMGDYWDVRDALLDIFGSRSKMSRSINGQRIIYPDESRKVKELFDIFGITDIWDE